MFVEWLQPLLEWTGLGLIPFLITIFIIIYVEVLWLEKRKVIHTINRQNSSV